MIKMLYKKVMYIYYTIVIKYKLKVYIENYE